MLLKESPFLAHYAHYNERGDIYVNPTREEFRAAVHKIGPREEAVGWILHKGRLFVFPYNTMHEHITKFADIKVGGGYAGTWELNNQIPHGTFMRSKEYGSSKWKPWHLEKVQGPRATMTKLLLSSFLKRMNSTGPSFSERAKKYLPKKKVQAAPVTNENPYGQSPDVVQAIKTHKRLIAVAAAKKAAAAKKRAAAASVVKGKTVTSTAVAHARLKQIGRMRTPNLVKKITKKK